VTDTHEAFGDTDLIAIQAKTTFVLSASGRIESENKLDLSGGPRLILAGCETGNIFHVHRKVDDAMARALEALAADEPPLFHPHGSPHHLDEYVALLSPAEEQVGQGLNYVFPPEFTYDHQVTLGTSGTSAGDEMGLATSFGDVMPSGLKDLGFRDPADIWEPWCIALVDGKIASIADTVRAGEAGVEVGVDTVPELRGRCTRQSEIACASTATQSQMTRPGVSRNGLGCAISARVCGSRKYGPRLERSRAEKTAEP